MQADADVTARVRAQASQNAGHEKQALRTRAAANLAIVTAYNDMLSAHQPYEHFPALIKKAAHEAGGVAQVAGGVPAMYDGITKAAPAWNSRCSRATSLPCRRRSPCRTICSMPRSFSASATKSCRDW